MNTNARISTTYPKPSITPKMAILALTVALEAGFPVEYLSIERYSNIEQTVFVHHEPITINDEIAFLP